MKIVKAIAISIAVLCLQGTVLFAQKANDSVYLKNGDVLTGTIVQYSITDNVVLELRNGLELTIGRETIDRVEMSESKSTRFIAPKHKQWYNQTSIRSLAGQDATNFQNIIGAGIQNVTGYQFNKLFGLGIGIGYDMYNIDRRQAIIPVFTEVRGRFLDKKVSPQYSLGAGLGFGINAEENGISKIKPGFMWNPAFGFSIQGRDNASFSIDIGYQFQYITNVTDGHNWNANIIRTVQDYHYKRLALRMGIMF